MRILGVYALCLILIIGGGIAWCSRPSPSYTYRYRMTVEVSVDGAVRSGSSVIEVRLETGGLHLPESNLVRTQLKGDAVYVDLGHGRNVIALLASGANGMDVDFPTRFVPRHAHYSYSDQDLAKLPTLQAKWDLPSDQLPTFVTFTDLNDPKTARVLAPGQFEQIFGAGVHFKRVSIEMTNEPMMRSIESKLPWLRSHKGYLGGDFDLTWSRPSLNLTGSEFIRGM